MNFQTSSDVWTFLEVQTWTSRHPDNGSAIKSAEFRQFLARNRIGQALVIPYHPSFNGQARRFVEETKKSLKKSKNKDVNFPSLASCSNNTCRHAQPQKKAQPSYFSVASSILLLIACSLIPRKASIQKRINPDRRSPSKQLALFPQATPCSQETFPPSSGGVPLSFVQAQDLLPMKSAFQMVHFGKNMLATSKGETTTCQNATATSLILRHISLISSVNQNNQTQNSGSGRRPE
ncbi:hypothetical protein HPB48_002911 [Haemaphysalis longicornis]|uniref:Integrase catalytic domain-containing protein n=1 Tax=Haemaphysalis longicornis TaxID=44386 RepID=A0A9J6FF81_HAELO|nr:hypothetical protein HPB48_002911 [Haemaphysalis longicornis]